MKHTKNYLSIKKYNRNTPIHIEGPVSKTKIADLQFHHELIAFRPPPEQWKALQEIAELPEARIFIATVQDQIIGYVTFLHPDPIERWAKYPYQDMLELGAIEIAPAYRGNKLGSHLIETPMKDEHMENYIILSTEYYWHWDLNYTTLSVWDYRKIMEKMMKAGDLYPAPTNEPEIMAHPANCLMVRIGKNVPKEHIEIFDKLRFLQ
ncbi:GNAT family N-acetyltransferase [Gracilibacillus caseinilyticus]|uniref:GNAT family N-acetyltransferase n=1 Tax=Gracilibacillus caseinilyticus TaxID=2932256 RepID=A0ABY4ERR4_9BACI|nr:GNAT family N-acetyltransferase [Gracilibacillus caseinilyticus]UOQ47122.1 GNAT family N-acetyltransferase [Gracilibacillus caseinilyticus]